MAVSTPTVSPWAPLPYGSREDAAQATVAYLMAGRRVLVVTRTNYNAGAELGVLIDAFNLGTLPGAKITHTGGRSALRTTHWGTVEFLSVARLDRSRGERYDLVVIAAGVDATPELLETVVPCTVTSDRAGIIQVV